MRLSVLVLGWVLLLPARAATVEVLVRERQGGPIAHQRVILQPAAATGELPFWERDRIQGLTGENGRVTFESVALGRFAVTLGNVARGLVDPSANPYAPPPQITSAAEKEKVSVEIEVWRGSLLSGEVIMDRADVPRGAKVVLRSLDGERDVELPLDARGRVERLLLPGRYEVTLAVPPGYLLVDIVWNGESLPGHVVRFDLREDTRRQSVSWYLSSPCLITGRVADALEGCPVRVVATLVQPGTWIQAATERGGSSYQVVPHQEWVENQNCIYRLWLPDGMWTVQPQGGDLLSSDPEKVDVTIARGETRALDFQLTLRDGDDTAKGRPLIVAVLTPRGRPLIGATVEIWPPGAVGLTEIPLRTARTDRYGQAVRFRGLAAGDYVVAAGHEEYLEATAKVEGYDPTASEPTTVTVTLKEAAKLHAHALDEEDRPVQGVELSYTRLTPLPETAMLADREIVTKKQSGAVLTDLTGHLEIPGLYSGEYRLEARMTGEQSATRFVLFRQRGAKDHRSIDVRLVEGERSDVELLVLPAASLSGGLACSDRGTMPAKVSFRIFSTDPPAEVLWRDNDLVSGAVLAPGDVVLRGPAADRFHLGPLSPGAYRLAARPSGQRYWSWASNELVPDRAALYPVAEADLVDTGVVQIECGPLVAVVPEIGSQEPLPDLRLGRVHASFRLDGDEKGGRDLGAEVEMHADRVVLRRLREGKFRTTLTVEHPYLIPPSIAVPEQVLPLTRGDVVTLHVAFERLGGSVEVRGDGRVARLTPAEGDPVTRPVTNGKAEFPGTIPGIYRVDSCGDPDCSSVTATWTGVAVLAGRTTFLP